jgi:site-specific recombinase XerD
MLSISVRAVDYLIAHRDLATRRIGTRVLVSVASIRQYARADHPQRLAS